MKHATRGASVCLWSVLLAACDKDVTVHPQEYYKQHPTERAEVLKKCQSNPDLISSDQNCRNAADAEFRSGSFKNSQPKSW